MKKLSLLAIALGLVLSPMANVTRADSPESTEGVNAGQAEKQSWWQKRKARSQAKRADRQVKKAQEEAVEAQDKAAKNAVKEEKARAKAQKKAEERAAEQAADAQKKAEKEAKKRGGSNKDSAKAQKKAEERAAEEAAKAQKEARKLADKENKAARKAEKEALDRAGDEAKIAAKAEKEALEAEQKALARAEKEAKQAAKAARKSRPKLSKAERRTQQQLFRIEDQIKEFNEFAADETALEKLYDGMWRHYSISPKRFKARLETFPHVSVGEMFVATLVASNSHKNIADVIESNYDSRPWSQMAQQYHVDLNKLINQTYKVAILVRAQLQAAKNAPETTDEGI